MIQPRQEEKGIEGEGERRMREKERRREETMPCLEVCSLEGYEQLSVFGLIVAIVAPQVLSQDQPLHKQLEVYGW